MPREIRVDMFNRIPEFGDRIVYSRYKGSTLKSGIVIDYSSVGLPIVVSEEDYNEFLQINMRRNTSAKEFIMGKSYNTPKSGFAIAN